MIILIVYESIEGQTEKIAYRIAEQIENAHHQVILSNVREPGAAIPGSHDGTIVCGPIHMDAYPSALVKFVTNFKSALNDTKTGLVTVSLAAASTDPEEQSSAARFADKLSATTGWTPTLVHNAAGALKYLEYNYFKRIAMRYIVGSSGGPVDTKSDYEFTDWKALEHFVTEFLTEAARPAQQQRVDQAA